MDYDVFISHASEHREKVARPLADKLRKRGLSVWLDEFELKLGDSLRQSIDHGLAQSRFGVVVLSHEFFKKDWPQHELEELLTREVRAGKVVLPIWHNITPAEILEYSPILADKVGVSTERGLEYVAQQILQVIKAPARRQSSNVERYSKKVVRGLLGGVVLGMIVGAISTALGDLVTPSYDRAITYGGIIGAFLGAIFEVMLLPFIRYIIRN